MGYVYLIKFDKKLADHAQYYLGFSEEHPSIRYHVHKRGLGAVILLACNIRGIDYTIVRIWENVDRKFERKLKKSKQAKRYDINMNCLPLPEPLI